ncbi:hypothetical protein ACHAXS_005471 [Conticribra weissflogii]
MVFSKEQSQITTRSSRNNFLQSLNSFLTKTQKLIGKIMSTTHSMQKYTNIGIGFPSQRGYHSIFCSDSLDL